MYLISMQFCKQSNFPEDCCYIPNPTRALDAFYKSVHFNLK